MQLTLRGSSCIYQGDELGLPEAKVPFEMLEDVRHRRCGPSSGAATATAPRRCADVPTAADLGFGGDARPWLPYEEGAPAAGGVDRQQDDSHSLLSFYRGFLHWRRGQPALISGEMTLLPLHPQVLAYVRSEGGERLLCAFNLSEQPVQWELPAGLAIAALLADSGLTGATQQGAALAFDAWGGAVARLG